MKRIAIIGANESINKLILKAKQKGYETHVFAWAAGDIGEKTADCFYPISIADKEQILDMCKKIRPDGIASVTSDFAVNTVNYVARNLGLTCNSEKTDEVARNKYQMRCALRDAGLYVPQFFRVKKGQPLDELQISSFPVIVKPTDRWSSKGVTRVDCYDELGPAIDYAISESLSGNCIVEEFMDGPEYSCETISFRGKHEVLTFTQKITTGYPHYIETGHNQPSDIPEETQKSFLPLINKALDALDIKNGASHIEFRILPNGKFGIIEIGARMGGDCIGTDLVQLSTGKDFVGMVVDVACGIAPDLQPMQAPQKARVRFILSQEDIDLFNTLKETSPQSILFQSEFESIDGREVLDSSTRYGYYIYTE